MPDESNDRPSGEVTRRRVIAGGAALTGAAWVAPAVLGTFSATAAHGTELIHQDTPGSYTPTVPTGRAVEYEISGGGGGGANGGYLSRSTGGTGGKGTLLEGVIAAGSASYTLTAVVAQGGRPGAVADPYDPPGGTGDPAGGKGNDGKSDGGNAASGGGASSLTATVNGVGNVKVIAPGGGGGGGGYAGGGGGGGGGGTDGEGPGTPGAGGGGGGGSKLEQGVTSTNVTNGAAGGAGGTNDRTDDGTTGAAGTDGHVYAWLQV